MNIIKPVHGEIYMNITVGIDTGTQSTKVVFYDYDKKQIAASASAPHELISGDDGTREQKAEWWIEAIESCFSQVSADKRVC